MLISTEIGSYRRYGNNCEVIGMLRDAGFSAYDFSMFEINDPKSIIVSDDYIARAEHLRAFADSIGIVCNQSHAPFPTDLPDQPGFFDKMKKYLIRAIEVSDILGANYCIVHPCNYYTADENARLYNELLPALRGKHVKVAVENMWNRAADGRVIPAACSDPESFLSHLAVLDPQYFGACLDIGHAEMGGLNTSATEMIHALGSKLSCLHIHDNDKIGDSHALPYTMAIDFGVVTDALAAVGYRGDITLEADTASKNYPRELLPALAALAAKTARYIKSEVERGSR